jgi:CheY-like chemotaxis protein
MSHEIRTPINGVMGMLQLLQAGPLDAEQTSYTATAIQSCKRLVRLLSDILDLSRIEAKKLSIQLAPMSVSDVFCQTRDLFLPIAHKAEVELCFDTDPTLPTKVLGDAARLQQVLFNLVGNALKFTPSGNVTVAAHALSPLKPGHGRVLFSVCDTGIGIPDENLGTLFEPFSQVDSGYTRSHQGAGLGLSICKRLVHLMGGSISVVSEAGVGTSIYFALDFEVESGLERFALAKDAVPTISLGGRKILLAEDDPVSAMAARAVLQKQGATVSHVQDGQAAIEALTRDTFDLVLMDVQMPVMDGVEATKAIRAGRCGEGSRNIPIVALTAYAMAGDKDIFLDAGMNGYVEKPVTIKDLLLAILSTGGSPLPADPDFPLIICPNVNMLMLSFMAMIKQASGYFQGHDIRITESHQASKSTKPGTAVHLAQSLGVPEGEIRSERNPKAQNQVLGIPSAYLDRHAYHEIVISDAEVEIRLQTRVLGKSAYASGLARLIELVSKRRPDPGCHDVVDLVTSGYQP